MRFNEVCRLCLAKENLCWFLEYNVKMKDIVLSTTGVEILTSDLISQKICTQCAEVVTKIWHFRIKSLKTDRYLRDLCEKLKTEGKLATSDVIFGDTYESSLCDKTDEQKKKSIVDEETENSTKSKFNIHGSVRSLFKSYPNIKIPRICIQSDVSPFVLLPTAEVEGYFRNKKVKMNKPQLLGPDESTLMVKNNKPVAADIVEDAFREKQYSDRSVPKYCENETVSHEEKNVSFRIKWNFQKLVRTGIKRKLPEESVDDNFNEFIHKKSGSTQVCEVCGAILFDLTHLKKHYYTHKHKCPFCKKVYKTYKSKQTHIQLLCKKAMQFSPKVKLVKLENDRHIINKYTTALEDFNLLPNEDVAGENALPASVTISAITEDKNNTIFDVINTTYNTVSIVKPDIIIHNGDSPIDIYDPNCSEKVILKDLLSKQMCAILPTEKSCQTSPIPDISSTVNASVPSIIVREINVLDKYPLPIFIQNGPAKIAFSDYTKENNKKILRFWNSKKPNQTKKLGTTSTTNAPVPIAKKDSVIGTNSSQPRYILGNNKTRSNIIVEDKSVTLKNVNSCKGHVSLPSTQSKPNSTYLTSKTATMVTSPNACKPQIIETKKPPPVNARIQSGPSSLNSPMTLNAPTALTDLAFQSMFTAPTTSYASAPTISTTVTLTTTSQSSGSLYLPNTTFSTGFTTQRALTTIQNSQNTTLPQTGHTVPLSDNINDSISNIPSTSNLKAQKICTALPASTVQTKTPQILIPTSNNNPASINLPLLAPERQNIYILNSTMASFGDSQFSGVTWNQPLVSSSSLCSPFSAISHYSTNQQSTSENLMNAVNSSVNQLQSIGIIQSTENVQSRAYVTATNTASISAPKNQITTTSTESSSAGIGNPSSGFLRVKPLCDLK